MTNTKKGAPVAAGNARGRSHRVMSSDPRTLYHRRKSLSRAIRGILAAAGLVLLIGTAGAIDTDTIGMGQALVQMVIGTAMMMGGVVNE